MSLYDGEAVNWSCPACGCRKVKKQPDGKYYCAFCPVAGDAPQPARNATINFADDTKTTPMTGERPAEPILRDRAKDFYAGPMADARPLTDPGEVKTTPLEQIRALLDALTTEPVGEYRIEVESGGYRYMIEKRP